VLLDLRLPKGDLPENLGVVRESKERLHILGAVALDLRYHPSPVSAVVSSDDGADVLQRHFVSALGP
jgi:hypothetical protein